MAKKFTDADVTKAGGTYSTANGWENQHERISVDKEDLIYDPPAWMKQGLQETASGYGKRLNSGYMIDFNGKLYRVYTTIFSNNGTCWFKTKGRKIVVG